jgi:hypothetical protein
MFEPLGASSPAGIPYSVCARAAHVRVRPTQTTLRSIEKGSCEATHNSYYYKEKLVDYFINYCD